MSSAAQAQQEDIFKADCKHIVYGFDKMRDMMDGIIKKQKLPVDVIYRRGQIKRFFYTDKHGYRHRVDFFEKREGGFTITNPYVFRAIKNDLIKYKENIIYNPQAKNRIGYKSNKELISSLQVGQLIYHTDMSHCYLQIAKRLNYISDEIYCKLIKKYDKAKTDICIAFTTAFSEEAIESFRDGKQTARKDITNYEIEYALENICWEVFIHVDYLYKNFQQICLGYLIDCVYSLDAKPIHDYFRQHKIEFKTITYEYWGDGTIFSPEAGIKKLLQ